MDPESREILRHLNELKEALTSPVQSSPNIPVSEPTEAAKPYSYHLRIRAERAAEQLLADAADAKTFLDFISFYMAALEACPTCSLSNEQILRVFRLFEGNVMAAAGFMPVFEELIELGFGEDEVVSALLLCNNDREAALDHLMKQ